MVGDDGVEGGRQGGDRERQETPREGEPFKMRMGKRLGHSHLEAFALGNLQKCVGGFLLYKFWRILPGIFPEDFSGHFFTQK